jgi:phospholipase C
LASTSLSKIEHFVVLMLENRSFDHLFGFRHGVDGLHGDEANRPHPSSPASATNPSIKVGRAAPFAIPTHHALGPFHNVPDVTVQLYGPGAAPDAGSTAPGSSSKKRSFKTEKTHGKKPPAAPMSGFVTSYDVAFHSDVRRDPSREELGLVMQSYSPSSLPAINALAAEFCLFDRWFCEVPGPTHPNRLFVHCGTSAGFAHNVFDRMINARTIYELLDGAKRSWATYEFDKNDLRGLSRVADRFANFRRFEPDFQADIDAGGLANYSFIIPRFMSTVRHPTNSQHAPHDVRFGDHLVADVYDALRGNAKVWKSCALVVTWDEHGGFYDHVPPPAAPPPDRFRSPRPDDTKQPGHSPPPKFAFDRLGVRVPALLISPYVGRGSVIHAEHRHTSILRTVRRRFGIHESLSAREDSARSFEMAFSLSKPRSDTPMKLPRVKLPTAPPVDHHAHPANQRLDTLQKEIVAGVAAVTRASHPEDVHGVELPLTQGQAAEFVRSRYERHEIHRKALRRGPP